MKTYVIYSRHGWEDARVVKIHDRHTDSSLGVEADVRDYIDVSGADPEDVRVGEVVNIMEIETTLSLKPESKA